MDIHEKTFERLVHDALAQLPERISTHITNVAFCIEEAATNDQLRKAGVGKGSALLGLYEGVPKNVWGRDEVAHPPDKITIFRKPILAQAATPEAVIALVQEVVWHEVAHHFGFDEHGARSLDRKRRKSIR